MSTYWRPAIAACGSAALVAVMTPAGAGVAASSELAQQATAQQADGQQAGTTRTVTYSGYRVDVPSEWPVVRLASRPHACVRFDRPAVYLGHPGNQQVCPADLVGGAPGLVVEPLDDSVAAQALAGSRTASRTGRPTAALPLPDGSAVLPVEAAGVLVTATYGFGTVKLVQRVLDNARLTKAADRLAVRRLEPKAASSSGTARAGRVVAPGTLRGKGFDACTAPAQKTMNAWRSSSPYRSIGVYVGGISRACSQANLTRDWVATQVRKNWHLLPTYVGRQAPCTGYTNRISSDPSTARAQGRAEASDAIKKVTALGMRAPSAIYSDMEGYDNTNSTCRTAVLSYLSAWTTRLHRDNYLSGVYSSGSSGIRDLAAEHASDRYVSPDHIWIAWWNYKANTDGGDYVADSLWADHQRVHQYAGNVTEKWGGYTINIDRNFLDVDTGPFGSAARTCPAPLSFSRYPALRRGADGRHVRAAECRLVSLGYKRVRAGGSFDDSAVSALKKLESSLGLNADSVLGRHTWTALLAAGSTPRLERGAHGTAVRRLQRSLTAALRQEVTTGGSFKAGTVRAVRNYQRARHMNVTGVAGQPLWRALQAGR